MKFWINCQVHYQFQVFICQLETFHEVCGKGKQNKIYLSIANLCDAAFELLFQEIMPEGPDIKLANISGGIQTQMELLIDTKEGNENSDLFTKHYNYTSNALKALALTYNHYLALYHKEPELAQKTFKEMQAFLIPLEKLREKILSLKIYRLEKNNPLVLFKRAARYSPKLMVASGVLISASVFAAVLSIIDHTIGPAIDQYLDQKIEKKMDYKDLLSAFCFLIALFVLTIAMIKNYRANPLKSVDNNDDRQAINAIEIKNVAEIIEIEPENTDYTETSMFLSK